MSYRIRFSPRGRKHFAQLKLKSEAEYPATTKLYLANLQRKLNLLTFNTELGAQFELRFRRILHDPYYVYYRVNEETKIIEVLAIWHCKRLAPELA